jgi:hypothetical protein
VDTVDHSPGPEPVDAGEGEGAAPVVRADEDTGPGDGEEGGADAPGGGPPEGRDPLRFNSWMKRSATGAVMTGIAVGLQQALELPRQEPAFVIEASGEPEDPNRPIDLHFDPDNPADTVAIIRRPPVEKPDEEPTDPS